MALTLVSRMHCLCAFPVPSQRQQRQMRIVPQRHLQKFIHNAQHRALNGRTLETWAFPTADAINHTVHREAVSVSRGFFCQSRLAASAKPDRAEQGRKIGENRLLLSSITKHKWEVSVTGEKSLFLLETGARIWLEAFFVFLLYPKGQIHRPWTMLLHG